MEKKLLTLVLPVCLFILVQPRLAAALDAYKIPHYYLDAENHCRRAGTTRVTALADGAHSGLIYSHRRYNGRPYAPGERNCIVTLLAPKGYRLRLAALEFNINETPQCRRDSLSVFDQDAPLAPAGGDPSAAHSSGLVASSLTSGGGGGIDAGPGPMLGTYCGRLPNGSVLAESTHNALTIWWHPDGRLEGVETQQGTHKVSSTGFRLLWTAFRRPEATPGNNLNLHDYEGGTGALNGQCTRRAEFACNSGECIAAALACDTLPHCADQSDLDLSRQRRMGCTVASPSMLGSLHGVALAGFCVALVLGSVMVCVTCLICWRAVCPRPNNGASGYVKAPVCTSASIQLQPTNSVNHSLLAPMVPTTTVSSADCQLATVVDGGLMATGSGQIGHHRNTASCRSPRSSRLASTQHSANTGSHNNHKQPYSPVTTCAEPNCACGWLVPQQQARAFQQTALADRHNAGCTALSTPVSTAYKHNMLAQQPPPQLTVKHL